MNGIRNYSAIMGDIKENCRSRHHGSILMESYRREAMGAFQEETGLVPGRWFHMDQIIPSEKKDDYGVLKFMFKWRHYFFYDNEGNPAGILFTIPKDENFGRMIHKISRMGMYAIFLPSAFSPRRSLSVLLVRRGGLPKGLGPGTELSKRGGDVQDFSFRADTVFSKLTSKGAPHLKESSKGISGGFKA